MPRNAVTITTEGLHDALRELERMDKSITPTYLKTVQARKARKHFVPAMKAGTDSARMQQMISVTQAKKFTSRLGVRVGVVKNDVSLFPKFSAQALASILEYSTIGKKERFRQTGIFSAESTGVPTAQPWLRNAYDANVEPFINDVRQSIHRKVDKI